MKFMFLTSLNDGMSVSQILFSFCLHTACHFGVNGGEGGGGVSLNSRLSLAVRQKTPCVGKG